MILDIAMGMLLGFVFILLAIFVISLLAIALYKVYKRLRCYSFLKNSNEEADDITEWLAEELKEKIKTTDVDH